MESKEKKIFESFDLSKNKEKDIDEKTVKLMLKELITSSIEFTEKNDINNAELNRLAQTFPNYFSK